MEFDTAISTCFRKFARFRGRARRSEYWIFNIFGLFCFFVAYIVDLMMGTTLTDEDGAFAGGLFFWLTFLVLALPLISVAVRRLHDSGSSGWWYWIQLIPFAGPLLFLIWMCTPGTDGSNDYGPDPLDPEAETAAVFE